MKLNKLQYLVFFIYILFGFMATSFVPSSAAASIVHGVLFYSPTCGHCRKVMDEILPPIQAKYGSQLEITKVDVTSQEGQTLFQAAVDSLKIPNDRVFVPLLVVGSTILVGDIEIPDKLPGLITVNLSSGGVALPSIPGIEKFTQSQTVSTPMPITSNDNSAGTPIFIQRFKRDIIGNSVAVFTLLVMLGSVIFIAVRYVQSAKIPVIKHLPFWVIPLLCALGVFVAGYMTYIEITHRSAVCGPVGDCNSVQQSRYARLWGILPIGLVGLGGYFALLLSWFFFSNRCHKVETNSFINNLGDGVGWCVILDLFDVP